MLKIRFQHRLTRVTIQDEIQELKRQITMSRERAAEFQHQLDALLEELLEIKTRYDAEILPHWERIETVNRELAKLKYASWVEDYVPVEEQFRQSWVTGEKTTKLKEDDPHKGWTPPEDYVPVEEQFRRAWTPHKPPHHTDDFIPPPAEPEPEIIQQDLKTLYRHLARRYHPDFAESESDAALRNRLMAEINQAYEDEDIEALRALFTAGSGGHIPTTQASQRESAEELQLRQLKIIQNELRRKIFNLKQQIHDLEQSDLMRLKHQEWLMRLQGRNLFKEMAEQLEIDYASLRDELYRRRRR